MLDFHTAKIIRVLTVLYCTGGEGSFGTISYCPLSLQTSYVPLNIGGTGTWAYPDHSTAQLPPNVLDTQL